MTDVPEGALRSEDGYYWWDETGQLWQPVADQPDQSPPGPTVNVEFMAGPIVDVPEFEPHGDGDEEEAA